MEPPQPSRRLSRWLIWLELFEEAWQQRLPPCLDSFLQQVLVEQPALDADARRVLLEELIKIDLEYRWRQAEPEAAWCLEVYASRYPELGGWDRLPLDLIGEEYRARQRWGDRPTHQEYVARFPHLGEALATVLDEIDTELAVEGEPPGRGSAADAGLPPPEACAFQVPDAALHPPAERSGPRTIHYHSLGSSDDLKEPQVRISIPGYEILGELGRGGMGVVYKARQQGLKRLVALKMILSGVQAGEEELSRFRLEAEAVARLQHPNIVQIYEVGETDGRPFFSLEFVDGGSLEDRLDGTPQAARPSAELLEQLARAVHAAHQCGVIHRDLKPANVLLAQDGTPKITDFGLAKQLDRGQGHTQSGDIMGTPSYMAPEQAAGRIKDIGPATDVYALGAILYEVLTGRPPFAGEDLLDTLDQVRSQEPVPPRRLVPKLPRDLDTICLKCLQKHPLQRYASAEAFAEDVRRFLAGEPIHARPAGAGERALKWVKRRPAVAGVVGVTLLALLSLLGGGSWSYLAIREALQEARERRSDAEREKRTALEQGEAARRERQRAEQERDISHTALQREGTRAAAQLLRQRHFSEKAATDALNLVPRSRRGWEWHRLAYEIGLAPHPEQIVGQHDWGIVAGRVSRDGRLLITSGNDGRVVVRNTVTLAETELERGKWSEAWRLWQPAVDPRRGPLPSTPETDCVVSLSWVEDGTLLAGASLRGRGIVWDLRDLRCEQFVQHDRPLYVVAVSADGEHLLFGDDRGTVLYKERRGGPTHTLQLKASAVLAAISLFPQGWVIGQQDGTVSLVDLRVQRVLVSVTVRGPVWGLDLETDGKLLVVACGEPAPLTFRLDSVPAALQRADTFALPEDEVVGPQALHAVRFSPHGQRIFASDQRGRLLCWKRGERLPQFVCAEPNAGMWPAEDVGKFPLPLQRRIGVIELAPDGEAVFTAGQDCDVKRWNLAQRTAMTTFSIGLNPRVRFDPERTEGALLWVATADGNLALWDSRKGEKCCSVPAHTGAVSGLDLAAEGKIVATCGVDRTIRFWQRVADQLRPVRSKITHTHSLRSVALSPDGRRVAAYDTNDTVSLWDVESGRLLAGPVSMQTGDGRAVAGLVAFNASGSILAAAGPGQSFWLLSGTSLDRRATPSEVVTGRGATAITWHPQDLDRVVGGDTQGRVHGYASSALSVPFLAKRTSHLPVVGLAFTPDGSRLAVAYQDGAVHIFDHRWCDLVHTLTSSHPGATGVAFDRSGRRLALVHQDGHVAVWETGPEATTVPKGPARTWEPTVLLHGHQARDLTLRHPAVSVDPDGRLGLLYSRLDLEPQALKQPARRRVVLGREFDTGFWPTVIEDCGDLNAKGVHALARSLALTLDSDQWLAVLRRPRSDVSSYSGQLVLSRCPPIPNGRSTEFAAAPGKPEPLFEPANWGFDTHLLPGSPGKPTALHFAHDRRWLLATFWADDRWHTVPLGRQGDGLYHRAAADSAKRIHAVFNPRRFDGDPSPLVYLAASGPRFAEQTREVLDPTWGAAGLSVTVTPDGSPVVFYTRPAPEGRNELLMARRGASGWNRSVVFNWLPRALSNVVCDPRGTLRFAYLHGDSQRVLLATHAGQSWSFERVWENPKPEPGLTDESLDLQLITLVDTQGRPVILLARQSPQHGWLRMFRPAE